MAFNSKYNGEQVEALLDKINSTERLWGYECFAVKKAGMDDPDTLKQEIEAFIEAGGGDADSLVRLMQDAGLGNLYVRLVNSDEGDSVVSINGVATTIPAGETFEGFIDSLGTFTDGANHFKSIVTIGDWNGRVGQNNDSGTPVTSLESVEMYFSSSNYSAVARHWFYGCTNLTKLVIRGKIKAVFSGEGSVNYFRSCPSLKVVDGFENIDFSQCENLGQIFNGDSSLESVDLSNVAGDAIINTSTLFQNCASLKSVRFSDKFYTPNLTGFYNTFSGCTALEEIDMGERFTTAQVYRFYRTFYNCTSLVTLNLGNDFDMGACTEELGSTSGGVAGMFSNCNSLTNVTGTVKNVKLSLNISYSPLTRESALIFINGLSDEPAVDNPTLSLSSATKALLTDDDIAIATNKGWTIA